MSRSRAAEGDSCQGATLRRSGNSFVGRSPSTGSHGRVDKGDSLPCRFRVTNGWPGSEKVCKRSKECENLPLFLCAFVGAAAGSAYRFKKKKKKKKNNSSREIDCISLVGMFVFVRRRLADRGCTSSSGRRVGGGENGR